MEIEKQIRVLVEDELKKGNIYIDSIIYEKEDNNYFLRIIILSDKGVDLDECIKATKIINPILDKNDIINTQYILDVCSKGGN